MVLGERPPLPPPLKSVHGLKKWKADGDLNGLVVYIGWIIRVGGKKFQIEIRRNRMKRGNPLKEWFKRVKIDMERRGMENEVWR